MRGLRGVGVVCSFISRGVVVFVKGHVPPCVVLVINDNPYRLMFALSYICRTCS
jgi:hypothetical protein